MNVQDIPRDSSTTNKATGRIRLHENSDILIKILCILLGQIENQPAEIYWTVWLSATDPLIKAYSSLLRTAELNFDHAQSSAIARVCSRESVQLVASELN